VPVVVRVGERDGLRVSNELKLVSKWVLFGLGLTVGEKEASV
jgi:hypothetical protein